MISLTKIDVSGRLFDRDIERYTIQFYTNPLCLQNYLLLLAQLP